MIGTILWLGVAFAILFATAPLVAQRYVARLPDAPGCPACCSMTRASGSPHFAAVLLPALGATAVRQCGQCGWRGRMRWRWAAEQARGK